MFKQTKFILALAWLLNPLIPAQNLAIAQELIVGNLTITNPIARATPPGAKVGGGYVSITNHGSLPDYLLGGSAHFAAKVEIHEMNMTDGIMRMKKIEGGLKIPAGGTVTLQPGGNHIMFMQLNEALTVDQSRKVTLTFKNTGMIDLIFSVKSIAETMKLGKPETGAHKGHLKKKMKMKTDG
ncbi:MAG: copper chaperone PCu(A)C [Rhizobiaceae bacterium]